jgi:two-component system, response regulator YesN
LYKVILVDDEPMIREGLRTLIDWEEAGFEVVDTAANGKDALHKHALYKPNLMIVDIRMPGMDGLELIEELRKQDMSMHILILSGYADFDYAKKAIANRVDGYLLKPVDEDELAEYLEKIRKAFDREAEENVTAGFVEEWDKERLILAQLTGEHADYPNDKLEMLGLSWKEYEVVLIKLLSKKEIDSSVSSAIKRKLSQLFESKGKGAVFSTEPLLGILYRGNMNDEYTRHAVYQEIERIVKDERLDFVAVSGGAVAQWKGTGHSYESALKLMKDRFFFEGEEIFTQERAPILKRPLSDTYEDESAGLSSVPDKLYLAVDIKNKQAIDHLVETTAAEMMEDGLSENAIKTRFVQIATAVLGKLSHHRSEIQEISQQFSTDLLEIYKEYRFRNMVQHFSKLFHRLADSLQDKGSDDLIKKMIDLIHRNYYENLKLDTLADVFNYNSAYLGKLFKNATGEHFNTYLDKVRMEQAKQLLEQGDKVYQVAEKVGYSNVDYFHAKFRKYMGTSPSAYRKK